jgi:hypothetical protein
MAQARIKGFRFNKVTLQIFDELKAQSGLTHTEIVYRLVTYLYSETVRRDENMPYDKVLVKTILGGQSCIKESGHTLGT